MSAEEHCREYRDVLRRALTHALDFYERLDLTSVCATTDRSRLRKRLAKPLPIKGNPSGEVIDELVADVSDGLSRSAGGRFFGWVIGGSVPAAVAADWLTTCWDQNAALYSCSPAGAVVEEVCGDWLKQLFGLPENAGFALVTGCQMAHVACLAAARHALLISRGWDVEKKGLAGSRPIRIVTGTHSHGSLERAARLLGLGAEHIVTLPTDASNRLAGDVLTAALSSQPDEPTIVVMQAGDINTGAFDPFEELIPSARRVGAWVHVDGAFGLWAAASPQYRHLLHGVSLADSWSADGHKWLNVPYDSGFAFVAKPESLKGAMSHRADYLTHDAEARDQIDWTPEWSRRCRGMATYAAIRQLGRNGIAGLVERTCRFAADLVARIGALPCAEVLCQPSLNQGLIRFLNPGHDASQEDHDRFTNEVIQRVCESGEAFFTGTTWRGKRCMRVSVCNWMTDEDDVDRSVEAVKASVGRGV